MPTKTPKGFSMEHNGGIITGPDEQSVRDFVRSSEESAARRARWPSDTREAMTVLAESFPTLKGSPGVRPWDEGAFLAWLCTDGHSHGRLVAAQFILSVWNPSTDWAEHAKDVEKLSYPEHAKRFDLLEAIGIFDRKHTAALIAWIDAPFWP